MRNGIGKLVFNKSDERLKYYGNFKDNIFHGLGVLNYKNGSIE